MHKREEAKVRQADDQRTIVRVKKRAGLQAKPVANPLKRMVADQKTNTFPIQHLA
jgi:hypothetical protein